MVYLHFPSNLTDEETSLQTKYQKLRKKKKALTDMKAPKVEPEKTNLLKRPLDPKDAKELAKKLILQGKVLIPKTPTVERTTFKRSRGFERKIGMTPRSDSHGTSGQESIISPSGVLIHTPHHTEPTHVQFEPFTPSATNNNSGPDSNKSFGGPSMSPFKSSLSPPSSTNNKPRFNSFRGGFGAQRERENPHGGGGGRGGELKPKRGPTLYIHGHGISEDFLKDTCSKFGKVISVKLSSASAAFVTFDKVENAETCITELNKTVLDDITLDVQFARKQPTITGGNDSTASASWQVLATSLSHKGAHQDKRAALVYDETI